MPYPTAKSTVRAVVARSGKRSVPHQLTRHVLGKQGPFGIGTLATARILQAEPLDVLEALVMLSTPEFDLLRMRFFTTDSEGGDLEFPEVGVRAYLEGGELLDPRTGTIFRRPEDVSIQFVPTTHLLSMEAS